MAQALVPILAKEWPRNLDRLVRYFAFDEPVFPYEPLPQKLDVVVALHEFRDRNTEVLEKVCHGLVKRLGVIDHRTSALRRLGHCPQNRHGRATERGGGKAVLVVSIAHHLDPEMLVLALDFRGVRWRKALVQPAVLVVGETLARHDKRTIVDIGGDANLHDRTISHITFVVVVDWVEVYRHHEVGLITLRYGLRGVPLCLDLRHCIRCHPVIDLLLLHLGHLGGHGHGGALLSLRDLHFAWTEREVRVGSQVTELNILAVLQVASHLRVGHFDHPERVERLCLILPLFASRALATGRHR
mmetsp:Transcript_93663/g.268053  ORF Transcript_93663/g.268053 Transcript_93663/m.268053 type:complete len:300 (-) Transcript_93663:735-1634(-)